MINPKKLYQIAAILIATSLPAVSQEANQSQDPDDLQLDVSRPLLEPMTVVGSKEDLVSLQGSGYFVDTEEIRTQNYSNVN